MTRSLTLKLFTGTDPYLAAFGASKRNAEIAKVRLPAEAIGDAFSFTAPVIGEPQEAAPLPPLLFSAPSSPLLNDQALAALAGLKTAAAEFGFNLNVTGRLADRSVVYLALERTTCFTFGERSGPLFEPQRTLRPGEERTAASDLFRKAKNAALVPTKRKNGRHGHA